MWIGAISGRPLYRGVRYREVGLWRSPFVPIERMLIEHPETLGDTGTYCNQQDASITPSKVSCHSCLILCIMVYKINFSLCGVPFFKIKYSSQVTYFRVVFMSCNLEFLYHRDL